MTSIAGRYLPEPKTNLVILECGGRKYRALNITDDQFRRMQRGDGGALQEKHAHAIDRMYEVAGLNLKTATEAEKASL
jgi:hypothetical protein